MSIAAMTTLAIVATTVAVLVVSEIRFSKHMTSKYGAYFGEFRFWRRGFWRG